MKGSVIESLWNIVRNQFPRTIEKYVSIERSFLRNAIGSIYTHERLLSRIFGGVFFVIKKWVIWSSSGRDVYISVNSPRARVTNLSGVITVTERPFTSAFVKD